MLLISCDCPLVPAVHEAVGGLEVGVDPEVAARDEQHSLHYVENQGEPKKLQKYQQPEAAKLNNFNMIVRIIGRT